MGNSQWGQPQWNADNLQILAIWGEKVLDSGTRERELART